MQLMKEAFTTVRQNGVIGALKIANREGYLISLLDGNLFHTKMRRPGARLVGEDQSGNKYWEKYKNVQAGRERWVEYKDSYNYNASSVPPEWHGWLHYISDYTPDQLEALKPSYLKPHRPNMTGSGNTNIRHAKGHALNPDQRKWNKQENWTPISHSGSTP